MGKVRKNKPRKDKNNAAQEETIIDEELVVDSKENAIQTILDQLQAVNVEEKYCGLQTLALLIESPENIEEVLNRGVVKSAAPLLLDSASSVRNATAGVLRNLSAAGLETCDSLIEQDVVTPLTCYFHEHTENWVPDVKSATNNEDKDTLIHCLNLLWNLCESSEIAIKYLGQSRILDILLRYLDLPIFGSDLVAAVLQCLFVVVEDNPLAIEKVKQNAESSLQKLLALEDNEPSSLLIRTLSAGVIINTCSGNVTSLPVDVTNRIVTILSTTLSVDHRLTCNQLSSSIPLIDDGGKVALPKGKDAEILEKQLKAVSLMLDAQQSSVEIIANLCSCDDDEDSIDADQSDSDDMEDEAGAGCGAGGGAVGAAGGAGGVLPEDRLSPLLLEAFVGLAVFDKVWARAQLPADNVMMILSEYEGSQAIHKKLVSLQSRALLCINNMLSTLPAQALGGARGVGRLWVDAGKLAFRSGAGRAPLEPATAVMRAALDRLKLAAGEKGEADSLFADMALSDIEMMFNGIKECQSAEVRSNLIRMVGLLALLLTKTLTETSATVVATITDFIVEQAHKESEVWVLAEAIDTLIDLYSEDETDELAAKVKLVEKMAPLAPILKNKARQQRALPREYKVLVSTALSNLPRFLAYQRGKLRLSR